MRKGIVTGLLFLGLGGCAQLPHQTQVDEPQAETDPAIWRSIALPVQAVIQPHELLVLSKEQEQHFLAYYFHPERIELKPHVRLAEYLESRLYGFDYKGETTTAYNALSTDSGNCLSLALVTTALAKLVGIQVEYQKVNSSPMFLQQGGVMMLSGHVRSHVYDPTYIPEEGTITIIKPKVVIDYVRSDRDVYGGSVSKADFMAMYYQNKAGDALAGGDLPLAYSYLLQAIEIAPDNVATLNTLAVVANRVGDYQQADKLYELALLKDSNSLLVVSNYVDFLKARGRQAEAQRWADKILQFEDRNPYRWIALANQAIDDGRLHVAASQLDKALELAPYLHDIYFALAKLKFAKGQHKMAEEYLQIAKSKARSATSEQLYVAKLHHLQKLMH